MGNPVTRELNPIYCKYKPDLSLPSLLISVQGLSLAQRTKSLSSARVFGVLHQFSSTNVMPHDVHRSHTKSLHQHPLSSFLPSLNSLWWMWAFTHPLLPHTTTSFPCQMALGFHRHINKEHLQTWTGINAHSQAGYTWSLESQTKTNIPMRFIGSTD